MTGSFQIHLDILIDIYSLIHLTEKLAAILMHVHTQSSLCLWLYFSEFSWRVTEYFEGGGWDGGGGVVFPELEVSFQYIICNIPRSKLLLWCVCSWHSWKLPTQQ